MLFSGISYASVCRVEILVCRCIEFLRRGIVTKSHLCDDFSARTRCGNARDACNRKAESDSSTRREVRATACSRVIAGTRRAGGSSVILLLFSRSFALSLFFSFSLDRMSASIGFTDGPLVPSPCSTEQNQVYCNSWGTLSFHYIQEVKGSHFRNCRF